MRNHASRKLSLVVRLYQAGRLSAVCIANGMRGAKHCAANEDLKPSRLWGSFLKQTIRDLACIAFHEVIPDPYETRPAAAECAVLFIPGYSMTAKGASPLLSYLAGAGFQIAASEERMRFKSVRRITRWAYDQVALIQASGLKPILLGYSMGGDIAQHVAGKTGIDVVSLSTPNMAQHTFFAALDLILRGRVSSRKALKEVFGTSLSEAFSFHIPRPDYEGHITIKGVYSHFGVNNPEVIQAVACRLEALAMKPFCVSEPTTSVPCLVVYSGESGSETAYDKSLQQGLKTMSQCS